MDRVSEFVKKTQPTPQPPPSTVTTMDTLQRVVELMDDGNVHLVFVVSYDSQGDQKPLHVFTQRDVLEIVCKNMGVGGR